MYAPSPCICARVLTPVFTRWRSVYSVKRRRWSPIHCRQGWSKASSTASAWLMAGSGRPFFSRSWSFISDGLSPTTQSCSVACSRSESGRTNWGSGWLQWCPNNACTCSQAGRPHAVCTFYCNSPSLVFKYYHQFRLQFAVCLPKHQYTVFVSIPTRPQICIFKLFFAAVDWDSPPH